MGWGWDTIVEQRRERRGGARVVDFRRVVLLRPFLRWFYSHSKLLLKSFPEITSRVDTEFFFNPRSSRPSNPFFYLLFFFSSLFLPERDKKFSASKKFK